MASLPTLLNAYELETHGAITKEAYTKSALKKDFQLLNDLGIKSMNDDLGDIYYDVDGATVLTRFTGKEFEDIKIDDLGVNPLSIQGWLMRGVIREDDVPLFGENPLDDPINEFRVYNYFYDQGFKLGLLSGDKAPNWALGTFDFTTAQVQDNCIINHL